MPTQAEIDNAVRAMEIRRHNFGLWSGDPNLWSVAPRYPTPTPEPEPAPAPAPAAAAPAPAPVAPAVAAPAPAAPAARPEPLGPAISPGRPISTGEKLAQTMSDTGGSIRITR